MDHVKYDQWVSFGDRYPQRFNSSEIVRDLFRHFKDSIWYNI